jgi:hypothetical protein
MSANFPATGLPARRGGAPHLARAVFGAMRKLPSLRTCFDGSF